MKSLRVNADYESILFQNKPQQKISETIEFLAFYLSDRPILSQKNYSSQFLQTVEAVTGRKVVIKKNGEFENWWGELRDPELEKWLNSKVTSTELVIQENWAQETYVLSKPEDLKKIAFTKTPMISKDPFEMSGRGFRLYPNGLDEKQILDFENKDLILEPLLNRSHDFSHYVFPDGRTICYENLVDAKFQYKGTLFRDWTLARMENLRFYGSVPAANWTRFGHQLEKIKDHYSKKINFSELKFGFSIDSLVYRKTEIHPLCEVNFRRTMGRVAYELSQTYSQDKKWTLFLLLPPQKDGHLKLKPLIDHKSLIVLSPEDTRFTLLFLMAENDESGKGLVSKLKSLLSLSELPVDL